VKPIALIVIGASTGGVAALQTLASKLTPNIPAAILIVLHIGRRRSLLPEILQQTGPLPASHATNVTPLRAGHIHVAPPDHHLNVVDGAMVLTCGPRENWTRPAIDPLFRTAARAQGRRVIGVILTGSLNDGSAGLRKVRDQGGTAVIQHPSDASSPMMPMSALRHAGADYCVPLAEIPPLLHRLAAQIVEGNNAAPGMKQMVRETP
jgi:two-component system chemotaxis response regulator CheB